MNIGCSRIVVVDGDSFQGEGILVICKFQPDGIVNILPQGGSLVPGIDGAVGDHEIPQEHPRKMRGGYPHVGGEHDGSGVTPEHEAFPVPESGYPGIEAYACQPLFCRPVSESAALTPEQGHAVFGPQ